VAPCIRPPAPVVPVQGLHGRPLYLPDLPRPWGLPVWAPSAALTPRKVSVDRPRSGGFQDRARIGPFVSPMGPFGPPAPAVPAVGTTGGRRVSMVCPQSWDSFSPLILDVVLVISLRGRRVWRVAPVFPLRAGLLVPSVSSFSATISSGQGVLIGEFPPSGEVFPTDTT
jgi:hypothetical protein